MAYRAQVVLCLLPRREAVRLQLLKAWDLPASFTPCRKPLLTQEPSNVVSVRRVCCFLPRLCCNVIRTQQKKKCAMLYLVTFAAARATSNLSRLSYVLLLFYVARPLIPS